MKIERNERMKEKKGIHPNKEIKRKQCKEEGEEG